jgi:hypothetical protein
MMEIAIILCILGGAFWWFLLRPRPGGSRNAPPLVSTSTVVPIPLIGHICEFFKSPNEMVKRCYRDYGSIFTIPVRAVFHFLLLLGCCTNQTKAASFGVLTIFSHTLF